MANTHTLDLKEAAAMLKVHRTTALELIQSGKIPAAKVGRAYVLLTKDVLAYVQNQILDQTGDRLSLLAKRKPKDPDAPLPPVTRTTRVRRPSRSL